MKISAKCRYATKALIELSYSHQGGSSMQIREISRRQHIPAKYLIQILLQLKGAQIVESIRGKSGGYHLAKSPGNIRLGDVVRIMEEVESEASMRANGEKQTDEDEVLERIWYDLGSLMSEFLDSITFENLIQRCRENSDTPDFVI